MKLNTIEQALEALKAGKMIVVADSEDRENEGDLIASAELATSETINFMATHAKGLICTPMSRTIAEQIGVDYMVINNKDAHQTPFGISIDYCTTTTGISTSERALTANKCADPTSKPSDFKKPGHMFPLIAKDNGVLQRPGHTEATVDLMKLAGLKPCGLCCEIMNEDGTMCRVNQLADFAKKWNLVYITIEQIQAYRKQKENLIEFSSKCKLPTEYGEFDLYCFIDKITQVPHFALVKGTPKLNEPVLCRMHSECLTGDVFHSLKCDCGPQLNESLAKISKQDTGVLLYLKQEGRNIGIVNKLKAYELQDKGLNTIDANLALGLEVDGREYYIAAQILKYLNINEIELLTNNPDKISQLNNYGIQIKKREPIKIDPNKYSENYLCTKQDKMGHLLDLETLKQKK